MTAIMKRSIERRKATNRARAYRNHTLVMYAGITLLVVGIIINVLGNMYFS
jgi:hypothetical protein